MLSSSAGSLGLLERARLLGFARAAEEDAVEDMVEEGVGSMEEEENLDIILRDFILSASAFQLWASDRTSKKSLPLNHRVSATRAVTIKCWASEVLLRSRYTTL